MSQPLIGKKKEEAEVFYEKLLRILIQKNLPFMVGGTYAFNAYTGLDRPTGDIDIKSTEEDYPKILKALAEAGFHAELREIELNWLAKVHDPQNKAHCTDIIFAERNGLHKIDSTWLKHAREGNVLGHRVRLEPVEEMVRSKIYVQNRHRADSGDVVHLILKQGKTMDWNLLLEKTQPHWELLMAHILFFLFVYPSERKAIPTFVIDTLLDHVKSLYAGETPKNKVTRGLLLSNDYQVAVSQWGYTPITELK